LGGKIEWVKGQTRISFSYPSVVLWTRKAHTLLNDLLFKQMPSNSLVMHMSSIYNGRIFDYKAVHTNCLSDIKFWSALHSHVEPKKPHQTKIRHMLVIIRCGTHSTQSTLLVSLLSIVSLLPSNHRFEFKKQ